MPVTDNALLRTLPEMPEILAGLQSGKFTLHGGVVRHAAGTGKGGQIVGHLIFPGDAGQVQQSLQQLQTAVGEGFNVLQGGMDQLQQSMNVLQGLQVANLALSGLNLAVSAAGFVIVCRKLDVISQQIERQSHGIAQTFQLVSDVQERGLLADVAQFRALLLSSEQFCAQGETGQLKSLIAPLHKEYQFTRLVLERHAHVAASNMDRFSDIEVLQDRLVQLGMVLSHVQVRTGGHKFGQESLNGLAADITRFNVKRVEVMSDDRDVAARMTRSHLDNVMTFLRQGKDIVPALRYQAGLIELDARHPGILEQVSEFEEVMLLAA